jgi:hypothetical protein
MRKPTITQSTAEAFHFPRNARNDADPGHKQNDEADSPVATLVDAKPARTTAAKKKNGATPAAAPATEVKTKRAKKEKVVRDSFTMPKSDYEKIAALKQKCLEAGVSVKKSELLRAGLLLLESASFKRLLAAVSAVETVKTGRPANS